MSLAQFVHLVIIDTTYSIVPELPGLPSPGKNTPPPDLARLVTLQSLRILTFNHSVGVYVNATAINPVPPSVNMRVPSLPFIVSLPNMTQANVDPPAVPIVKGHVASFPLTHPNISLSLSATILPITRASTPILSSFISAYLAGKSAPIVIGTPLLPSLGIPMMFPAPYPKPKVLQDVAIRNMRISVRGETVYASGLVFARVVLPMGIRLKLDVQKIWPDVLVYDGEVPEEGHTQLSANGDAHPIYSIVADFPHFPRFPHLGDRNSKRPKPPLPSPLPEGAFARIRPEDWLAAESAAIPIPDDCFPNDDKDEGASEYFVTARVDNVPLEVLPGRQGLMSKFVTKVLFGPSGALAGVRGTAAVAAEVDGLPVSGGDEYGGIIELDGLPFTGSFRVGKKGI